MPLTLTLNPESSADTIQLNKIVFDDGDSGRHYKLSDGEEKFSIKVPYIPEETSPWDPTRYECFVFENPYLTAENDIFEVHEKSLEGRFGWIFPVAALDSNEHSYADHKIFKHYRHIAYQKLLELNFRFSGTDTKVEYTLSDIFPDVIVCVLSKDDIGKLPNFSIEKYLLSFLRYDYLIYRKGSEGRKCFNKSADLLELRSVSKKIKIAPAAFDIHNNSYTKSLFVEHLYQSENPLIRYVLLYQIVEHFIEKLGDELMMDAITQFADKKILKNGLKEIIGRSKNDRTLLKENFENALISLDVKKAFMEKCTFLFEDLGLTINKNFDDAVYDLRNLVTHNYRSLTEKSVQFQEIVQSFEQVILELLIGYNQKTIGKAPVEEDILFGEDAEMKTIATKGKTPESSKIIDTAADAVVAESAFIKSVEITSVQKGWRKCWNRFVVKLMFK